MHAFLKYVWYNWYNFSAHRSDDGPAWGWKKTDDYGLLSDDENTSLFLLCDNMHSLAYVAIKINFVCSTVIIVTFELCINI